nr:replication protein A 70 kDa DNA-binding subunit B-like [Ipomoea batatas]
MDSTCDAPLLIWDKECYDFVGVSASSLRQKYAEGFDGRINSSRTRLKIERLKMIEVYGFYFLNDLGLGKRKSQWCRGGEGRAVRIRRRASARENNGVVSGRLCLYIWAVGRFWAGANVWASVH